MNYEEDDSVSCIEVIFHCDKENYQFSLATALDYLANDIYWGEGGNWAEATHATVVVI